MFRLFLPPPAAIGLVLGTGWASLMLGTYSDSGDQRDVASVRLVPQEVPVQTRARLEIRSDTVEVRDAIAQLSLFLPGRQPWVQPVEEPVVHVSDQEILAPVFEAVEPPSITYIGRMETDGRTRALVRNLRDLSEVWIEVGDIISLWSVVEIRPDELHLEIEGQEPLVMTRQ